MNVFTRPMMIAIAIGVVLHGLANDAVAQDTVPQDVARATEIAATSDVETVHSGFDFTEGPAWHPSGVLYFSDIPNSTVHRLDQSDALSTFTKQSAHTNGIFVAADGRILACQMDGRVVSYDPATSKATVLADSYEGKRFNAPNDLVIDAAGGIYFTDPLFRAPQPLPQGVQAVYYIHADGNVSRLTGDLAAPNGIGLSPDGKRLYVCPSRQAEMLVYDVEAPGKIKNERVFCRVKQQEGKADTGADGIALDEQGNVYITTHLGVEIFSDAGKHLGLVTFPEQPANVTFAGEDRKTMYVTARKGLYRVSMPIAGLKPN